jgi:hypothetical protein
MELENRTATQFIVCIVNEGGCIEAELGGDYDTLAEALKAADAITADECREAGAFNAGGHVGVNAQIWAVDENSDYGSNFVQGGMCLYDRLV